MTLKLCEQCELVSACGECTLQHSPKVCKLYQAMNRIDLFRIAHFELTGKASIYLPTKPRTSYKPLSSAANWADYYLNISGGCITLEPFLQRVLRQDLASEEVEGVPEGATPDEIHAARQFNLSLKLATDTLSRPLSIIAALEDIGLVSKEKITLHVIGAAGKEMAEMMLMEELLHLLPSLNHLDILYIGPNTPVLNSPFEYETIDLDCCPTCKSRNRRRSVTLYRALYHDFAQSPHYRKPDLAVLFHSGRSQAEEASWAPTTRYLLDSATMTLCTAYTLREAMEEYAELHQLGAKFLVEPEVNHWRSLLSLPELLEGTEHGVFYQNYYRYIFRGIRLDS
jgi:mitochondrial splicing suppressor protein 51